LGKCVIDGFLKSVFLALLLAFESWKIAKTLPIENLAGDFNFARSVPRENKHVGVIQQVWFSLI